MSRFPWRRFGRLTAVVLGAQVFFAAQAASAADWPQYRGLNREGVSTEKGWAAPTAAPKELWKMNMGVGASSVAVVGGKLYTMGNQNSKDVVWCLDAGSGKELWKHSYACALDKRSFEGGTACTPTVDGGMVYTLSHEGHLFCLNATTGQVIWQKHLTQDPELGGRRPRWGYAGSPLVEGTSLIVDVGGKAASTVAFNKATGQILWKSGQDIAGYGSPVAANIGERRTVVIFKGEALVGLSAADGSELWRFPWKTDYDVNAATPIVVGDQVFISSGYNRGCALLKIVGGKAEKVWENKNMRNHANGSVYLEGGVYGFDGQVNGKGQLACVKLADGAVAWTAGKLGTGALSIADGKVIALGEQGELVICEASPAGFKPLARFQAIGGHCWVMPVICNGKLYVRNNGGDLACLDVSGK